MTIDDFLPPEPTKPLAGACHHEWQNQDAPYVRAQICPLCRLFRYKSSTTADWEYRAPIPFSRPPAE